MSNGIFKIGRVVSIAVVAIFLSTALMAFTDNAGSIRIYGNDLTDAVTRSDIPRIVSVGDLDEEGSGDIIMALPYNDSRGDDSGSIHIYWGESGRDHNYLKDLDPKSADVSIFGDAGFELGYSFLTWDHDQDNWFDLVIGCPGADGEVGKVLIYSSAKIRGAFKGQKFFPNSADWILPGNDTYRYGTAMKEGEFSGDDEDDLIILSGQDGTHSPSMDVYFGGSLPEYGVRLPLPDSSVTPNTSLAALDISNEGREALIVSSPENGMVRLFYLNITLKPIDLPGADPDGTVRFTSSIESSGNTFGWGMGDDGWDTSNPHIYDNDTGVDSVRYNQATGNADGDNRAVNIVRMLQVELGGDDPSDSGGLDMSGAYGVSFDIDSSDLESANSVELFFNYKYESGGFEVEERLWVKGRFWDGNGESHWLGTHKDGNPEPDIYPEIYSMRGAEQGGQGQQLDGTGILRKDVLPWLTGPGSYYLDIGGKISQWTAATEFGAMGFDNLRLTVRSINNSFRSITGPTDLGSELHVQDVDGDGWDDLLISNPADGKVHIYKGNDSYWRGFQTIDLDSSNTTINGITPGSVDMSMDRIPPTKTILKDCLVVSDPEAMAEEGSGALHVFYLPITGGDVLISSSDEEAVSRDGLHDFGWEIASIGDNGTEGYSDLRIMSWTEDGRLIISDADRNSANPEIIILGPVKFQEISGVFEIQARVFDYDGDANPADVIFLWSINDGAAWSPFPGNGYPDRVEGDIAIKVWNTSHFENKLYTIRADIEDIQGHSVSALVQSVSVINHNPPSVKISYPQDGYVLQGTTEITADVVTFGGEQLQKPVYFFYSTDNLTWQPLAQVNDPAGGTGTDYTFELETMLFDDGPIWFMVNASTQFGLIGMGRNIGPVIIDNKYSPVGEFIDPAGIGEISGRINVTLQITDQDDDIIHPPVLQIMDNLAFNPQYSFLGNLTGPLANNTYFYSWDTREMNNGNYSIKATVEDESFLVTDIEHPEYMVIHNIYTPSIGFEGINDGDEVSGVIHITARITDKDANYDRDYISFHYRKSGGEWIRLAGATLSDGLARISWNTNDLDDGIYEIMVDVYDFDNESASAVVTGLILDNDHEPKIEPVLPSSGTRFSGIVRLAFNISDEEFLPTENVIVAVFARGSWVNLDGVAIDNISAVFTPWEALTYYIDWDTEEKELDGTSRFPDAKGYLIRIRITDSDGVNASWTSQSSYEVANLVVEDPATPGGNESSNNWIYLVIGFVVFLGLFILLIMIFLFKGESKVKKGEAEPLPDLKEPKSEVTEKASPPEPSGEDEVFSAEAMGYEQYEEPQTDVYEPPVPPEISPDDAAYLDEFMTGTEVEDSGPVFGQEIDGPVFASSLPLEDEFEKGPEVAIPEWGEEEVDVDLPAGVMPSRKGKKKTKKVKKPLKEERSEKPRKKKSSVEKKPRKAKKAPKVEKVVEDESWDAEEWGDEDEDWEELEEMEELEEFDEWEE